MQSTIESLINRVIDEKTDFVVEHPTEFSHGDYSTNVAMVIAKGQGENPRAVAEKIVKDLEDIKPDTIEKIEIAGPGFINFHLSQTFFKQSIQQIINAELDYGRNKKLSDKEVIIEYTDPNPFKQFHVGHIMSNTIGETISRLLEWNGAKVIRVCYQGDVGLHVAKAIWAMKKMSEDFPSDDDSINVKIQYLGEAYKYGAGMYKDNEEAKKEIDSLNIEIYKLFDDDTRNNDLELQTYYEKGRQWSLQHFNELYVKLGTNFTQLMFENQMAKAGKETVVNNTPGVFEMSDKAIIYKGEQDGLHTRVFVNSLGLPTYEAKDIGLALYKEGEISDKFGPFDVSILITAEEQKEYYKVVLAALRKIKPEIADKTTHITHGMMRFADGKMSSRLGNVVTGESMLGDLENMVGEKIADRGFDEDEAALVKEVVSIGAIKYSILRQAIGKDIIFDPQTSISFEGDSGPYVQYAYTRAKSVVDKAGEKGIKFMDAHQPEDWKKTNLECLLYRLPEVIEKSLGDMAPQNLVTLITQVAGEFNSFYGNQQILDGTDSEAYKVALTKATMQVLQNGLKVLGIRVVERM